MAAETTTWDRECVVCAAKWRSNIEGDDCLKCRNGIVFKRTEITPLRRVALEGGGAAWTDDEPINEEDGPDLCRTCEGSGEIFVRRNSQGRIDYIDGSPTSETVRCEMCDGEGVRS